MEQNIVIVLSVVAIIILASLSFYAGRLLFKLKQQTTEQQQKQAQAKSSKDNNLTESIQVIAKAVTQAQCEPGEGAMRLSVLLDHMSDSLTANYPKQYPNIHALNDKIKHLAILEARKKLEKKQRMQQDVIRLKAEAEFGEAVIKEAEQLIQFSPPHLLAQ